MLCVEGACMYVCVWIHAHTLYVECYVTRIMHVYMCLYIPTHTQAYTKVQKNNTSSVSNNRKVFS